MQPPVVINLYRDYIELLRTKLKNDGYEVPVVDRAERLRVIGVEPGEHADRLARARQDLNVYLDFRYMDWRNISAVPRQVLKAKNIAIPAESEPVVACIATKLTNGESVLPYLSREILNIKFQDHLLLHWGIHHLHLGGQIESDGFVTGTKELLFAKVTPARVLMLAVQPHRGAWTDVSLLERLLAEWPEELAQYRLNSVRGLETVPTKADLRNLRMKNANVPVQLSDGCVYVPGMVSGAGVPALFVRDHDVLRHDLEAMEEAVRFKMDELQRALPDGRTFGDPPTFRLRVVDGRLVVHEPTANLDVTVQ